MTPQEHREWLESLTQVEIDHMQEEYRRNFGESERDAAVRDTSHVIQLQVRKGDSA